MSIHELSVRFAAYMARELGSDTRQENRMSFGLELLLGELVKTIFLLSLSWILGILPEVLCISIAAGVLRLASGGEHCSEYYRCLVGSTTFFLILGGGVHYLTPYFAGSGAYITIAISILLSWAVLNKYAPGQTENRPINSERERVRFRRLSLFMILAYGIIMILFVNNLLLRPLALPILVGMVEQVFTVSPWGYRLMHILDGALDFKKWSREKHESTRANS